MIEISNVTKVYTMGKVQVPALRDISLRIDDRESVAIMGPSGSGKTTLMNLLGCLDRPTKGGWLLDGHDITAMNDNQQAEIRNKTIGFVFQSFNLLPNATALQNVEVPLLYRGLSGQDRLRMAKEALEQVGLSAWMNHRPAELSGGQQQRVAIARALVGKPSVILADEPTGNLDSRSGLEILAILQAMNQQGMTMIIVTHDPNVSACCRRVVRLRDGRIESDRVNATPRSAAEALAALPPLNVIAQ